MFSINIDHEQIDESKSYAGKISRLFLWKFACVKNKYHEYIGEAKAFSSQISHLFLWHIPT